MDYDKYAEEMTIVASFIRIFLSKSDIMKERSRMNMRLLSVSGI